MTYKQIEASREARLWIGQIIVPAITIAAIIIFNNPRVYNALDNKVDQIKTSIKRKFERRG